MVVSGISSIYICAIYIMPIYAGYGVANEMRDAKPRKYPNKEVVMHNSQ